MLFDFGAHTFNQFFDASGMKEEMRNVIGIVMQFLQKMAEQSGGGIYDMIERLNLVVS